MQLTQLIIIGVYLIDGGENKMVPYIVDGANAKILNFPYCAYLSIRCVDRYGGDNNFMCGSSIINQYLTLTAAHCTYGCIASSVITVSVGAEIKLGGAVSTALSFLSHKHFDPSTVTNDIALVKLNTPLQFSSTVSRVALMKQPPYDEAALVAGWGLSDDQNEQYPNALQYTTQYVKNKAACAQLLKKRHAQDGTFCASNHDGYPSKGDSGGALVVRHYIQIGLVSYKLKRTSEQNRKVVVYTDTGYFYNWIQDSSSKLLCKN